MAPAKKKNLAKARALGVDFKKVKHKVGRKLAPSSNVTKVDVKSKGKISSPILLSTCLCSSVYAPGETQFPDLLHIRDRAEQIRAQRMVVIGRPDQCLRCHAFGHHSTYWRLPQTATAIMLPGQSVSREKEGLSTNSRRLTLKELLTQTTHHNDNVRKDALYGIKDLLSRHPKELNLHAMTVVEKLCPRLSDKSKIVRQALLDLLRMTIFSELPEVPMLLSCCTLL
ncbi:hypothetical protein L7F22_028151 [Adiantum nelumboides]|nr:hypothetical protein [Adiantum nelumboides]